MSECVRPDPEEESFAASLRDGLRELRQERGPCPSSEELLAFLEERLNIGDSTRVRNHVDACGLCDVVVSRLASAEPERAQALGGVRRPIGRLFWNPVAAYGLVALLSYPAYLGLRKRDHSKASGETRPRAVSIPHFALDAQRSSGTAGQPRVLRLPEKDIAFVLEFFAPMRPDRHYFFEILDSSGGVTVSHRELTAGDAEGRVALLCSREAFGSGRYAVSVTEEGSTDRHFEYAFQIE